MSLSAFKVLEAVKSGLCDSYHTCDEYAGCGACALNAVLEKFANTKEYKRVEKRWEKLWASRRKIS